MKQEVSEKQGSKYLILGADGYIGSYLYERFRADVYDVVGTSRKWDEDKGYVKFDILKNDIYKILDKQNDKKKVVIFCIAQSNIDKCYMDYKNASMINVTKTKEIIKVLSDHDYKIFFFSTDNVFDGVEGNYSEESKTNPLNNYGKMKEEIEWFVMEEIRNACIFRLPKVLDCRKNQKNLLFLLDNMEETESYRCIRGNIMSFLGMEDLYRMILVAVQMNLEGIFHICGNEQVLRKRFIEKFFELTRRKNRKIIECDIADMPFEDKKRPLNVGMNNKKICDTTQYKFLTVEELILNYLDY